MGKGTIEIALAVGIDGHDPDQAEAKGRGKSGIRKNRICLLDGHRGKVGDAAAVQPGPVCRRGIEGDQNVNEGRCLIGILGGQ